MGLCGDEAQYLCILMLSVTLHTGMHTAAHILRHYALCTWISGIRTRINFCGCGAWDFIIGLRGAWTDGMASEPIAKGAHASFAVDGEVYVYVWGGETRGSSENDKLAPSRIEQFDPYLEVWDQLSTVGTPHPGFSSAACTSFGEHVYMYGGYNAGRVYITVEVFSAVWIRRHSPGQCSLQLEQLVDQ